MVAPVSDSAWVISLVADELHPNSGPCCKTYRRRTNCPIVSGPTEVGQNNKITKNGNCSSVLSARVAAPGLCTELVGATYPTVATARVAATALCTELVGATYPTAAIREELISRSLFAHIKS